jgi:sugar-specific transcriptional regulator TrmB
MPTLEEAGLVEKILAEPVIYKATPMKEGPHLLLNKKTKETVEIKKTLKFNPTHRNIRARQHVTSN